MDIVCLLTAAGVVAMAYYVKGYAAEYEKTAKSVTESNERVVEALKSSGKETAEAMRQLTQEIKRGNEAQRETACLLDPALRNRPDARDVCKRLNARER